jgi:predicted ATP-grasp superfamily ATP-dependent carboligase
MHCPPIENAAEFLPWLCDKVRKGEIVRVAPTTDLVAFYVSKLRAEFAPEVQRTIAPIEEIENCLIKTRFATITAASGCPAPTAAAPDSLDEALAAAAVLGYPVVMKPKSHLVVGFEERGHVLLNDADVIRLYRRYAVAPGQESIAAAYPELIQPLMQRYVPSARNRVYSVSGIKDADGGVLIATVSYKKEQWPPDVGVSTVQIAYENAQILEAGLRVVNTVLSRGIFEVELLAEDGMLYAIDLNPRSFGFMELDIARGADLPWLWYRSTFERLAPATKPLAAVSLEARHRFMHLLRAVVRRRSDSGASLNGRAGEVAKPHSSVSMLGHWSDPLPMIISNLRLLRHPRSLLRSQLDALQPARMPEAV